MYQLKVKNLQVYHFYCTFLLIELWICQFYIRNVLDFYFQKVNDLHSIFYLLCGCSPICFQYRPLEFFANGHVRVAISSSSVECLLFYIQIYMQVLDNYCFFKKILIYSSEILWRKHKKYVYSSSFSYDLIFKHLNMKRLKKIGVQGFVSIQCLNDYFCTNM